jgi:diguanylate cyclase (GGDEF)-like protein
VDLSALQQQLDAWLAALLGHLSEGAQLDLSYPLPDGSSLRISAAPKKMVGLLPPTDYPLECGGAAPAHLTVHLPKGSDLPQNWEQLLELSCQKLLELLIAHGLRAGPPESGQSDLLLASLFEEAPIAAAIRDAQGITVNRAFEQLFGFSAADLHGIRGSALFFEARNQEETQEAEAKLARHETVRVQTERLSKTGERIPTEFIGKRITLPGSAPVDLAFYYDLREQLQLLSELRDSALSDPLTGLPNRRALHERIEQALSRAQRLGGAVAVGILDLDGFKAINDQWGHAAGDELLKEFARRLQRLVRGTDLVARLGGDEFVLVLEHLTSDLDLSRVLQRIHSAVDAPFTIDGEVEAKIGFKIGLSLFPEDSSDPDSLLRHADDALYQLKSKRQSEATWTLWSDGGATSRPGPTNPVRSALRQELEISERLGLSDQILQASLIELLGGSEVGAPTRLQPEEVAALRSGLQGVLRCLFSAEEEPKELEQRSATLGEQAVGQGIGAAALLAALHAAIAELFRSLADSPGGNASLLGQTLLARLSQVSRRVHQVEAAWRQQQYGLLVSLQELVRQAASPQEILNLFAKDRHIVAAAIGRSSALGRYVPEFSLGRFDDFFRDIEAHNLRPLLNDPSHRLGQSPTARAWQSGELVIASLEDPDYATWRGVWAGHGLRSQAAIPLKSGERSSRWVLTLYSEQSGYFLSEEASHLLQAMAELLRQLSDREVDPPRSDGQAYRLRQLLGQDRLELHYQPVIDLSDGKVRHVEALARLRSSDTQLLHPAQFLANFGKEELDQLFRQGLTQALWQLQAWERLGVRLGVAVNVPPDALTSPSCAEWVAEALQESGTDPSRLQLELSASVTVPPEILADLARLGVTLALDDIDLSYHGILGAYQQPFKVVKLNPDGLRIRSQADLKDVGLVGSLARLAHNLDLEVVVGRLESPGLLEAASLLGGCLGQGYAISAPLPPQELVHWTQTFRWEMPAAGSGIPKTALGALASHWRWEELLGPAQWLDASDSAEHCGLTRYLKAQQLEGTPLDQAHREQHQAARDFGLSSSAYGFWSWKVSQLLGE